MQKKKKYVMAPDAGTTPTARFSSAAQRRWTAGIAPSAVRGIVCGDSPGFDRISSMFIRRLS